MRGLLAISIIDSTARRACNRNRLKSPLMRSNGFLISIALAAITLPVTPCAGATFGTVAAIAGHASDIALDESRGKLYIANYTANCIDVLTLATNNLQSCQLNNGGVQPGSLAL
jgi:hypothetical protein